MHDMRSPSLLPVLDILKGQVVHAIRGRRNEYRPVQSVLTASTSPLSVAHAIANHQGNTDFYVADLDALQGGEPQLNILRDLMAAGFRLWVDAAVTDVARAKQLGGLGTLQVIIASETLSAETKLRDLIAALGAQRLAFSLDLINGKLLSGPTDWQKLEPKTIAGAVCDFGIRQLIILDLAAVGTDGGPATLPLCRAVHEAHPDLEIISGGGIRGQNDVDAMTAAGVSRVLVATALHRGVALS